MSTIDERVAAYVASMPPEYRAAYARDDQLVHEAIVARRGDRKTHVEIWRELPDRTVGVCVVADDKPGLLSCICDAMVSTRIDVVSANAYCRKGSDRTVEAVDFLWIRRLANSGGVVPPVRARDIMGIASAIEEAAGSGERERPDSIASQRVASSPSIRLAVVDGIPRVERRPPTSARIKFDNDPKDGSTVLTVEATDRPGLLLAVTQALFRNGLQIIGLRAMTERGAAIDRFHIAEVDGLPLRAERLLTLQAAILEALDGGVFPDEERSTG